MFKAAVSPSEADYMAKGWGMGFAEPSPAAKAARDWALAASLDKKGDAYYAAKNPLMGAVCRARAAKAANRAAKWES